MLTRRRASQTRREDLAVTAGSRRWFTRRCGMAPEPAAVTNHELTAKGEEVNGRRAYRRKRLFRRRLDGAARLVGLPCRKHQATIYHDPRWGQIMASAYGNRPYFLTAHYEGRVVGILQLVAQKGLPFGLHLCSLPYFDAAGVVADDEGARRALLGETRALMERLGGVD